MPIRTDIVYTIKCDGRAVYSYNVDHFPSEAACIAKAQEDRDFRRKALDSHKWTIHRRINKRRVNDL